MHEKRASGFLVPRRRMIKGAVALPLAAALPGARATRAAAKKPITISIKVDGVTVSALLGLPEGKGKYPAIMLIHDKWGLNDTIKSKIPEFVQQGFVTLAIDLYGGKVAKDAREAGRFARVVTDETASPILEAWVNVLKGSSVANGRVATIGWGLGGGLSLLAGVRAPVDAVIVYYGDVGRPSWELENLSGPVLGLFGAQDQRIDRKMARRFAARMKSVGKIYEIHWYDADHAFADAGDKNFDFRDNIAANLQTSWFLKKYLLEED